MRFWSEPDTELRLAKDTGVQVFRMGIDWTRIMPEEPVNGTRSTVSLSRRIDGIIMHGHINAFNLSFSLCVMP